MLGRFLMPLAAAAALAAGAHAAVPGVPAVYVEYSADCTFTMEVDPGTPITTSTAPGPTLPPGTYQLLLFFPNPNQGYQCGMPVFKLTGPGVGVQVPFTGVELHAEQLFTVAPSSTYTAADSSPGGMQRVFTTADSGSSSSLVAKSAVKSGGKGSVQVGLVGSEITQYQGKLTATVGAAGQATLTRAGRKVGVLRPGRYDIVVVDTDAQAGFFVRRSGGKAVTLTGVRFTGRETRRVALASGSWTFFSTRGRATRFTVTR